MGAWENYEAISAARGSTKRSTEKKILTQSLTTGVPTSLSYQTCTIDGTSTNVAIINSDNLNEKTIFSMPGSDLTCGALVYWEENYWLITEKDAANEVYAKGKMTQCNFQVKWVSTYGGTPHVVSRWCIIEDGTKYMTGELTDNKYVVTRGDSRIQMLIAKDSETVLMERDDRFIIDDMDSATPLAYTLTKPLKVGRVYGEHGVYGFILTESPVTDMDDLENGIADYYKYFPASMDDVPVKPGTTQQGGRTVYL